MALVLDGTQLGHVNSKRLKPNKRPKYFNAQLGEKVIIGAEFEAFLILQGRPRNKETVDWLQQVNTYTIQDADRDALISFAIDNELSDAKSCGWELFPIADQFNSFRQRYNMTGFEGVAEAGQLLADLQRPMSEIIQLGERHRHRERYAQLSLERLKNKGASKNQIKQASSWFEALTTY